MKKIDANIPQIPKYLNRMDSLNTHVAGIGSQMKIISISGNYVQQDKDKCKKCGGIPTFFANFAGNEQYLCAKCAEKFIKKNELLPHDLWFCKQITDVPMKIYNPKLND